MKINLSPSFLSRVIDQGYDYAVGEKLGLFPKEDTSAMEDGRLIHALIAEKLGGEKAEFIASKYENYRTKEAREWRDSQTAPIVPLEKIETFNKIADRAINHPKIKPYLNGAKTENMIEKKVGSYTIKGVLDVIAPNIAIDWKFMSKANFSAFAKKALYMHYDLQASVYDFLGERPNFAFVCIESTPPHRIQMFECDQSFLDSGANKFDKAFKILDEAKWREPNFDIMEIGTLMSWENFNG